MLPTGQHCCFAVTFESGKNRRKKWCPGIPKVPFCNFDYCFQKQKWSPQRNVLLIFQIEDEMEQLLVKKDYTPEGPLYVCISTLITSAKEIVFLQGLFVCGFVLLAT